MLLFTGLAACAQEAPVLGAADLEVDANSDGLPDGWNKYVSNGTARSSVDTEVKHGGKGCLRVDIDPDSRVTITQPLAVPAAGTYTFGCWLKTRAAGAACLYIQWRRPDGTVAKAEPYTPALTGAADWTEVAVAGARPADATQALVVIVATAAKAQGGSVWADDAYFKTGSFPRGPAPAAPQAQAPTGPAGPTADPTFRNPGFEEPVGADGVVLGWTKFTSGPGFELSIDSAVAHTGKASARLVARPGCADRAAYTQVGPVSRTGQGVRVKVWYKGSGVGEVLVRWRPAPGAQPAKDMYGQESVRLQTPRADWTEQVIELAVPQEAQQAKAAAVEVIFYQKGEGTLWFDDLSAESLADFVPKTAAAPAVDDLLAMPVRPASGRVVLQNPPDFSWSPVPGATGYVFQLSQSPAFPAAQTFESRLPYNVYSHSRLLAEGSWYWRTRSAGQGGVLSDWGETRSFVVTAAATFHFPVPTVEQMLARIPAGHPRVYATAQTLAAFRAATAGDRKLWWENFSRQLESYVARPLDKEPAANLRMGDRPGGGALTDADIEAGNKLRSYCAGVNDRVQSLAFGYLLSGDRRFARKSIEQMLEMATWDPKGVTSYKNQDQVFRDIAWMCACAYDWCYDQMTPAERETIRNSILTRARTLYQDFAQRGRPLYAAPYDSHAITAYGYLGIIAIALAHEAPEADTWFTFVGSSYPAVFSPWGGEEGGWSQGVGYWKWSQDFAWYFFDALKSATGVDMYQKANTGNTGWYKLYMHPPWNKRHHFGDGNHGAPDSADQANLAHLGALYHNPYFQWYARNLPYSLNHGLYTYWWFDDKLAPRPPADLPQGRFQPDIGWVAMHSDLSDPDDIMLAFKSSPYGSYNHSHADQNSFVVYGYGEPLLIDSGYYDWYGSPHDMGFTRQTRAHNDVLVNGEGQPIMDMGAKGQVTAWFNSPWVDYTSGNAAPAYRGKLTRFDRHILYLRPDAFLIMDQLEAPQSSTFTWALHAEQQMVLKPAAQEVIISRGAAKCQVRFLTPQSLKFEQTDQFTPPSVRPLANEWHTYVTNAQPAQKMVFLTLVRPYRATEADDAVQVEARQQGGVTLVTLRQAGQPDRTFGVAPATGGGAPAFFAMAPTRKGEAVVAAVGARQMNLPGAPASLFTASVPVTAALQVRELAGGAATVTKVACQSAQDTQLTFLAQEQVRQVTVDGKPLAAGAFRADGKTVSLALPQGDHTVRVNPTPAAAEGAGAVRIALDGKPVELQLQSLRTPTGARLAYGSFAATATAVQVERLQAPAGARVQIGARDLRPGQIVWLTDNNPLSVRSDEAAGEVAVSLKPLAADPRPLQAVVATPDSETAPGAIKLEAESFVASTGGTPSRYSTRSFLSGGIGMGEWRTAGMAVTWNVKVPTTGKYRLLLKCATHEPVADRFLLVDGKPVDGQYWTYRIPTTGGFGATPEEWKLMQIQASTGTPEWLDLTAGEHQLTMTCVTGMLNVDYLVLVPR